MVLGNFQYDGWKLSQSRVNLDLNHILVAGKLIFYSHFLHEYTSKTGVKNCVENFAE